MKRRFYWFKKETVERIVRIIRNHKEVSEIKELLGKRLGCTQEQTEFILKYKLSDLISERWEYKSFFKGLRELEHKK